MILPLVIIMSCVSSLQQPPKSKFHTVMKIKLIRYPKIIVKKENMINDAIAVFLPNTVQMAPISVTSVTTPAISSVKTTPGEAPREYKLQIIGTLASSVISIKVAIPKAIGTEYKE